MAQQDVVPRPARQGRHLLCGPAYFLLTNPGLLLGHTFPPALPATSASSSVAAKQVKTVLGFARNRVNK